MKIDRKKLEDKLKNFDENSDYYIAAIPDNVSVNKIIEILENQKDYIEKNGLITRTSDYLHMTAIYLPALNKINQELVKINTNANLSKEKLIDFIRDIFDQSIKDENYVVEKVGCLGKRSVSLWMKGNVLSIHKYAIDGFKKLIINSGLSEDEFEIFVQNAGFSVLKYYRDQKFLPHIGIIKIPNDIEVSEELLSRLTYLYINIEVKVDNIELRKN